MGGRISLVSVVLFFALQRNGPMPDVAEPACEWCGARPASECVLCFVVVLSERCMREHIRDWHDE